LTFGIDRAAKVVRGGKSQSFRVMAVAELLRQLKVKLCLRAQIPRGLHRCAPSRCWLVLWTWVSKSLLKLPPEEASGCSTGSIRFLKVNAKGPSLAG
jgi:hypothetical protein